MVNENNEQYYDRKKLYSEVWEHTLIMLCKQYGVTYSELVNACKKLNVPRPVVGYWTQKDLGKAPLPSALPSFDNPPHLPIHPPKAEKKAKPMPVKKPVLKRLEEEPKSDNKKTNNRQTVVAPEIKTEKEPVQEIKENIPAKITNWQALFPQEDCIFPQAFEEAGKLIEKEKLPEMLVTLPKEIEKENHYVKNTRRNLEKKHKAYTEHSLSYSNGLFNCYGKERFWVNISPDSFERVFNLLQALCNAFEKRGFNLISELDNYTQYETYVSIMGEKLLFSIEEELDKVNLEKIDRKTYLDHKFVPTGILTFKNQSCPYKMEFQNSWSDTKESPLEDNLNDIIAGLIFTSVMIKEDTERKKREEEKRKREEALKRERERLAKQEKQRVVNFLAATEYWEQYQSMKAFLAMVRKSHRKSINKNKDTAKWIQWAREYLAKYKTICEDLVLYEVEEYNEPKEKVVLNVPVYNPPPEEPYNYWKRPWYQRLRH